MIARTCAVALFVVAAPVAAAQSGVELTPSIGLYLPPFEIINETAPGAGQLTISHKSAFAFGARLGVWVSPRMLVEGAVTYAPSQVKAVISGIGSGTADATITVIGAHLVFPLGAPDRATSFRLSGGLAGVLRGGTFWDDFEASLQSSGITLSGKNDLALVLGGGVRIRAGKAVALRIDLEDHIYQAKFTLSDATSSADTESQLQSDLHLSVGLAAGLNVK